MTDKVQKIREEVKKLHGNPYYMMAVKDVLEILDMQEEPVNEGLEEAAFDYAETCKYEGGEKLLCVEHFKAGVKWQKKHLWKDAQGDNLPEIDREVIALLDNSKVVFAHRPYKGKYIGKSLTTGNIEIFENETYDKGEWNIPDVKYWLDVELPKEIEL